MPDPNGARGWRDQPGHALVIEAFRHASHDGGECRPVHLLYALAEQPGPLAETLSPVALHPRNNPPTRSAGATSTYQLDQVSTTAQTLAGDRGEQFDAPHLLIALIDCGDPESLAVLADAGVDTGAVRRAALLLLGASPDLPAITPAEPTPAGTLDRPPLRVDELDPRVWSVLTWRQGHLPVSKLRRSSHAVALQSSEERTAWDIVDRAGVDEDQRYSLLARHDEAVEHRIRTTHPGLLPDYEDTDMSGPVFAVASGRLRSRLPNFMHGWPTWFANRRVGMRDRWFAFRTRTAFRGQPPL